MPSDKAQCGEAAKFQFLPNSFAVAHFPFVSINKAGRGGRGGERKEEEESERAVEGIGERGKENRRERKRGRAAASKAHIRHEILN